MQALDAVSLRIADREQVVLLGVSGSGKTTLLRALLGAVAFVGDIQLAGQDPSNPKTAKAIRLNTGVLRQGSDLVSGLSGRLNAAMGTAGRWTIRDWLQTALAGCPRRYLTDLETLAAQHEVSDCLDARVAELSGGQRQRIALVRALLPRPGLLLADEPTNGLDTVSASRAIAALRETNTTLLVTTHDLEVARAFPRVVALRNGRIIFDGSGLDAATENLVYR